MSKMKQTGKRAPVTKRRGDIAEITPETIVVVRPYFSNGGHGRRFHLLAEDATTDEPAPACRFSATHDDTEWRAYERSSVVADAKLCSYCDPEVDPLAARDTSGGNDLSAALAREDVTDPSDIDLEKFGLDGGL